MKLSEITKDIISDKIIYKLLYSKERSDYDSSDYMIIFGSHLKELLDERINRALEIIKEKEIGKIIVSGGVGAYGDFNESEYIINKLTENGVSKENIIVENTSTNTEENVSNCIDIIKRIENNNDFSLLLLTSQPHLYRIVLEFNKQTSFKNILIDYPFNSIASYELVVGNEALRQLTVNEILKLKRY